VGQYRRTGGSKACLAAEENRAIARPAPEAAAAEGNSETADELAILDYVILDVVEDFTPRRKVRRSLRKVPTEVPTHFRAPAFLLCGRECAARPMC
jgi:hypothetical protein